MPKEQMPRFFVDSKGEAKDDFYSRYVGRLEDIKNNAAREAGTDEEFFWKNVEERVRTWTPEELYELVSISNPDLLEKVVKTWGEKAMRLVGLVHGVYAETQKKYRPKPRMSPSGGGSEALRDAARKAEEDMKKK